MKFRFGNEARRLKTANAKLARRWADQSTAEGAGVPGIETWAGDVRRNPAQGTNMYREAASR